MSVSKLCLYTHTHTHTLLILWFGFTKQVLRHVFQEFIEKAFLMATRFFGGTTKHKPTEPTAYLGELPSPQRGHPRINTPHWHQSPELSEFHDPSSETQVRVHIHTLPRSKAGGNGVHG